MRRVVRPAALLAVIALTMLVAPELQSGNRDEIDVACDFNTFRPAEADMGPFGPGTPFVVEGVIYEGGTFEAEGANSGLDADGTPQFPDRVIGRWICRGWFLEAGGTLVATTQIYDLDPDRPGAKTLISDGLEFALESSFERAVTGGTGKFHRASGQVTQENIGVNDTGAGNFTFHFDLRPRRRVP